MYNYIIIGGGSSGGVLANRLSESGTEKVCLLEAGPSADSPLIRIPSAFSLLLQDFKRNVYNWRYNTEPDASMNQRTQYQPRGRGLGGSSSINGMVYMRGDASDFNQWESLGNKGWGYNDVLPYFKKAEHNERGSNEYHGIDGPLNVSNAQIEFDMYNAFLKSTLDLGYSYNPDLNGATQEGVGFYQFTVKDGKRAGVRAAYIVPAQDRENLTIQTDSHASRIIFEGKRAVGVEYIRNGVKEIIKAKNEVIVSSGSFNSPQLLLLSGVGPKEEVEQHGIKSTHDLAGVGKNLQEHPDVMLVYKSKKKSGISANLLGSFKSLIALVKYFLNKTGWIACPPTAIGGFFKTDKSQKLPSYQLHFVPMTYRDHARDWKILTNWGFSVLVNLSRPKSRGHVKLKNSNPMSPPSIQLNLLDHPGDMEGLREAVKKTREMLHGEAMNIYREGELQPNRPINTDEEVETFLREEGSHAYHPVGTCKMGHDDMAVVDDRLRVHGLEGLRVVDCSIMPTLISGNTNATAIMIGEKAADFIKEDNGHS